MKFREHRLDNGLSVVAECNDRAVSTSLGFFVTAGARDESDEVSGVSHFLEHMAFKGTPTRTADDVNRQFDEMGAHYNAQTSEESTIYFASVLPEHQGEAVELLGDILRPSLREDDFDTEKKVIVEEIRMYDDQPPFGAFERCMAAHYGDHPLHRSILGTVQSITDLKVEAMRAYFAERYSPQNIFLVATGNVDFDALTRHAERCCGGWPAVSTERLTPRASPHQGFACVQKSEATQQYIIQIANAPASTDTDRFAAKLLSVIVGDDSGSRLYWELVDSGRAEHASMYHYEFEGSGAILTYMSCQPEAAADNTQRLLDVQRRIEKEGIDETELAQAKSKICSRIVLRSERPSGRLFRVGANWISRGVYRPVRDELESFNSLSVEDIGAVLAKYPLSVNTTLAVGPLAELAPPS
ncbi:MAG: insulinase family protein [Planctomycetes bacterium]|nr:insulinase family protein [Planctomycetota bacterium]